MSEYTIYIDESGDLGTRRGTKWFVLTGVLVSKDEEPKIRKEIARINHIINSDHIHFREVKQFQKKCFIVDSLNKYDFTTISVLLDTDKNDYEKLHNVKTYNLMCRYLLERASWFLRDHNASADVILSARGTPRDNELIDYIHLIHKQYNEIAPNTIGKVSAIQANKWEMLQLADVCATSVFHAFNPGTLGYTMPCFERALEKHLYRYNGKYRGYGYKFFKDEMEVYSGDLNQFMICK